MTSWFAGASLRAKLTTLVAVPTMAALVLAAATLAAYEVSAYRTALDRQLRTAADIVGRSSAAALARGDEAAAHETLMALQAQPSIEAAALLDRQGHAIATYAAPGLSTEVIRAPRTTGARDAASSREVNVPVYVDGVRAGSVYVRGSFDALAGRLAVYALATLLTVVLCVAIAVILSGRMQRRIAKPILDLADVAHQVTSDRNFALRAVPADPDEVGRLADDFNEMLEEIEQRHRQLLQQQEQLTVEVANRTAALRSANAQLTTSVKRAEHYAMQIAQLTALGQLLQSCLTTDEVHGVVPHAMQRLFPDGSGALSLIDTSGSVIETMAMWGTNPPHQSVFQPAECWAFRRGRPHLVVDLDSPVRCAHLTRRDGPVSFCIPMTAQGDTVGVLQFSFAPGGEPDEIDENGAPGSTRARLVVALAEQIALALANLRLREALHSQSVVDPLTGLFNRRYLETVLERECRRATRAGRPLTVLMLDVDGFKAVNDTWGHDAGDVVLRELAALLRETFRGDDIACRYGGEEFVVVLTEATEDAGWERAEQLRRAVHRLTPQHRSRPIGAITVSIGLASLPQHGSTPEELLALADRALYTAKTSGRDRTMRATLDDGAAGVPLIIDAA